VNLDQAREHVGSRVVYRPDPAIPAEEGVITSVTDRWVFVRYGADIGAKATGPENLDLVLDPNPAPSPDRTDTLRGAVPLPLGTVRHRRTFDELLATHGSARVSPIQLTPDDASDHGITEYGRGCRCDTCREAKSRANRRHRGTRGAS
jgi:hypothetical protein